MMMRMRMRSRRMGRWGCRLRRRCWGGSWLDLLFLLLLLLEEEPWVMEEVVVVVVVAEWVLVDGIGWRGH